jgi:hypothetical protein
MEGNFNLGESLKEIEQSLKKELEKMPDEVRSAIMDRAFMDTKALFDNDQQDDFKSLVYTIYRSYILGMQLEKQINKQIPKYIKDDNIIKLHIK